MTAFDCLKQTLLRFIFLGSLEIFSPAILYSSEAHAPRSIGQLRGETTVEDNAAAAYAFLADDVILRHELTEHHDRGGKPSWASKWRSYPLKIWAEARGTSQPWFALDGHRFISRLDVAEEDAEAFDAMTRELVEQRLAEFRDRVRARVASETDFAPIRLRVSHSGGRPILRFDRARYASIPEGDRTVFVDGETYVFRFVRIAVNVAMRRDGPAENVLPQLMRHWFGPSAGLPGTSHSQPC